MDAKSQLKLALILRETQIASLGTCEGAPMVSMVPYLAADDFSAFYIHISALALHTQNLLADARAGLLITESGETGVDPQTLARVSIQGGVQTIELRSQQYADVRSEYLGKYPKAEINFQLSDFLLYAILPSSARYVAGFGRIYDLSLEDFKSASRTSH